MGRNFTNMGDLMSALQEAVQKKVSPYRKLNGKKMVVEMAKEAAFLEYGTKNMAPRGFIRKAKASNGKRWGQAVMTEGPERAAERIAEDIKKSMAQNGIGKEIQDSVVGKVVGA